ncbi:hypothetical protein PR202_ga18813 [Eleusine coracana subsp. coracana]|uniref:DUF6598 domain-containing protein n=1 Tax=Eleusine coracana subsp. coracana TaxID=191504 RepID=A0AAV5CSZ9_ELECO|nr:hypothetical protein PR202_ga18813 [Eleusine coracana subsp. coracana]
MRNRLREKKKSVAEEGKEEEEPTYSRRVRGEKVYRGGRPGNDVYVPKPLGTVLWPKLRLLRDKHTSVSQEDIVLLDSRDGRMPITCHGEIELLRSMVSVELRGELIFHVVDSQVGDKSDVVAEGRSYCCLAPLYNHGRIAPS